MVCTEPLSAPAMEKSSKLTVEKILTAFWLFNMCDLIPRVNESIMGGSTMEALSEIVVKKNANEIQSLR